MRYPDSASDFTNFLNQIFTASRLCDALGVMLLAALCFCD
jgi:hypothetical protein